CASFNNSTGSLFPYTAKCCIWIEVVPRRALDPLFIASQFMNWRPLAPLLEEERNSCGLTLEPDLSNPIRMNRPCSRTGFPAYDHPIDILLIMAITSVSRVAALQAHFLQQRLATQEAYG